MNETLKYQAYYTKSDPILDYMVGMLGIQPSDSILEPCGGDGVFVDKIRNFISDVDIDVLELNPESVSLLKSKYSDCHRVNIKETDTLLDEDIIQSSKKYDKIIGNPPYGARHDEKKRQQLSCMYPHLYTKESYTLFLYLCIRNLKPGGRLCFIIPDTFLSLHRHQGLREYLLTNTKIMELSLFPSKFFPGVKFGYANLCIITLERCEDIDSNLMNDIVIRKDYVDVTQLARSKEIPPVIVKQGMVYKNPSFAFMINSSTYLLKLINNEKVLKIGDIANCVTGFYSGNDKSYLHPANCNIKNSKNYSCVSEANIRHSALNIREKSKGISSNDYMIPIVKGGNIEYLKPNNWYMDWSEKAVAEFRKSKKCRFQNSEYYFREGIAIPMIRSSKLTASILDGRLFDQSIVGVFPLDSKWMRYLLAFFNTKVCNEIINIINPSANNSANYIKKIPFLTPDEDILYKVDDIVDHILIKLRQGDDEIESLKTELDGIFSLLYNSLNDNDATSKHTNPIAYQPVLAGLFG